MKGFYQWYRKHITGAIFAGLILGILTGLFLAVLEVQKQQVRLQERLCCFFCVQQHLQVLWD